MAAGIPCLKKTDVFIVEDHPIFRDGLSQLINTEEDLKVCGQADSVQDALAIISQARPDILIVDIMLKNSSGLDLVRRINRKYRNMPVLVLSMYDDPLFVERILKAGARGYVAKKETTDRVIEAIRHILGGGMYLSGPLLENVLYRCIQPGRGDTVLEGLSEREFQVLNLIGQGLDNKAIAKVMDVNTRTISTYRERIKSKLRLKNSAELNMFAIKSMEGERTRQP